MVTRKLSRVCPSHLYELLAELHLSLFMSHTYLCSHAVSWGLSTKHGYRTKMKTCTRNNSDEWAGCVQKRMEARLATLVLLEDGNPYGRPCWIARGFDVIVLDMPRTIVGFDVGTVNRFYYV